MNNLETQAGLTPTPGYQYAQQVGNQLFVAGQVPHDADGNLAGVNSPHIQANQCLKNLHILMNLYGFSDRDIRQLKVYVVGDQVNLTDAWQAVAEWFDDAVPPATLLGVSVLGHENQLVEIDATIVRIGS